MAHGNEIRGLLGTHHSRHLGDGQDVPLGNLTALNFFQGFRPEIDFGLRSRDPLGLSLPTDIDHPRAAGLVEVCKLSHFPR